MRIIKKYGNRRLYDTTDSTYINLAELAALIKAGELVTVEDATTKADLTRELLFQVLMEHEGGMDFLPVGMLRRIIRATGEDPAQKIMRQQLGQALHLLSDQMDRMEAMFPGAKSKPPARPPGPQPEPTEPTPPAEDNELERLRARLAALEERLG